MKKVLLYSLTEHSERSNNEECPYGKTLKYLKLENELLVIVTFLFKITENVC
jgi:hypothetical protein